MESEPVRVLIAGIHIAGDNVYRKWKVRKVRFRFLKFVPVNAPVTGDITANQEQIRIDCQYLLLGLFPVLNP